MRIEDFKQKLESLKVLDIEEHDGYSVLKMEVPNEVLSMFVQYAVLDIFEKIAKGLQVRLGAVYESNS